MDKNKKQNLINIFIFIFVFIFIITWLLTVYHLGAVNIVNYIGLNNLYIFIFIIAILSGSSSFVSATFFSVYLTLSAGINNHLLLAISGGLGLSIGDSIFYYLGRKSVNVKNKKWNKITKKLSSWMKKQSLFVVYLVIFTYNSFTPFPGDILNIILGLSKIKYKKIIIIIILGNISLLYLITYLLHNNPKIIEILS